MNVKCFVNHFSNSMFLWLSYHLNFYALMLLECHLMTFPLESMARQVIAMNNVGLAVVDSNGLS